MIQDYAVSMTGNFYSIKNYYTYFGALFDQIRIQNNWCDDRHEM